MIKSQLDEAKSLAELPMSELVMHNMEDVRRLFIGVVKYLQKENERLRECAKDVYSGLTCLINELDTNPGTSIKSGSFCVDTIREWLNKYSDLMEGR